MQHAGPDSVGPMTEPRRRFLRLTVELEVTTEDDPSHLVDLAAVAGRIFLERNTTTEVIGTGGDWEPSGPDRS